MYMLLIGWLVVLNYTGGAEVVVYRILQKLSRGECT